MLSQVKGSLSQLLLMTKNATYTLIATNIILGTLGIILNTTVASFYMKKMYRGRTVPFLYTVISLCNLITCTLALCHAAVLFLDLQYDYKGLELDEGKLVLILACYLVYVIVTRASIFHNLVLSVLRSINIAMPFGFYRVTWRNILPILVAFYVTRMVGIFDIIDCVDFEDANNEDAVKLMFQMPQTGEGFISFLVDIFTSRKINSTGINSTVDTFNEGPNVHTITITLWAVTLVLPCFLMLLTSIHQCYMITRKQPNVAQLTKVAHLTKTAQADKSKLTRTILIITALCLVCNTVYVIFYCSFAVFEDIFGVQSHRYRDVFTYCLSTTVYILHSVLEPAVFIVCGSSIRLHIKVTLKKPLSSYRKTREIPLEDIK